MTEINSARRVKSPRRLSLDEKLTSALKSKNTPVVTLEFDEDGNALVDRERYPDIYDWPENG